MFLIEQSYLIIGIFVAQLNTKYFNGLVRLAVNSNIKNLYLTIHFYISRNEE